MSSHIRARKHKANQLATLVTLAFPAAAMAQQAVTLPEVKVEAKAEPAAAEKPAVVATQQKPAALPTTSGLFDPPPPMPQPRFTPAPVSVATAEQPVSVETANDSGEADSEAAASEPRNG